MGVSITCQPFKIFSTLLRIKSFSIPTSKICTHTFYSSISNVSPNNNPTSITDLLNLSINSKSIIYGCQTHGLMIKTGFYHDVFLLNNLIHLQSSCGLLNSALKVFDEMPEKNLVSWTLIISGATRNGIFVLGVDVCLDMMRVGLRPNEFSFGSIMKACIGLGKYGFGLCVHCLAVKIGLESNRFVGCSILYMYAKSKNIEAAKQVFHIVENFDTGCWNVMIKAYIECGYGLKAARIVCSMRCKGVLMDTFTFIHLLKACLDIGDLDFGRVIHGVIVRNGMHLNTSVANALIDFLFKCGMKGSALKVFNMMNTRDVVSWNTLFSNMSEDADSREIATLFRELLSTSYFKPNCVTFSILFRLFGEAIDLVLGCQFYSLFVRFGFPHETSVASSIINMFSKCDEPKMARLVFNQSTSLKNIIIWNEMISGYNSNSFHNEAFRLFYHLCLSGVSSDEYTFSSILEVCSKSHYQFMGSLIHGMIVKTGFSNYNIVCSSLIKCYTVFGLVHRGGHVETMKLLNYLVGSGQKPDEFILGSILKGCADAAIYQQAKAVHSLVIKLGFETHPYVASAVVDSYGKCGDIVSARTTFDRSYRPSDIVLFNSMITAYGQHGLITEAMEIFNTIKSVNLQPSQSSFVSILSACNHFGQIEQGCTIFESISLHYGMQPSSDNYGCFVDMLSRNGCLEDAKLVIQEMPFTPWPAVFRSFLNGCRIHGDRELGEWGVRELVKLDKENDMTYVLLSKVYLEGGRWENAETVRGVMVERKFRKDPGRSWIVI